MTTPTIPVDLFEPAVFGATGDLSERKLLPALFHRDLAGQIPEGARIIGISRRKLSDDEFRSFASKTIEEHTTEDERKPEVTARFLARLAYVALDASQDDGWDILGKALEPGRERIRVFYLATSPDLFGPICQRLGANNLVTERTRVVVEKPIGRDLESAAT